MSDNLSGGWALSATSPSSIDPLNAGRTCVEYPAKRSAETSGGEPKANGPKNNTLPTLELDDKQKMLLFETSVVLLLDTDKETFVVVDNKPPELLGEHANGTQSAASSSSEQPLLNDQPGTSSTHASPTVVTPPPTSDTSLASGQSGPTLRPFAPQPLEFKVLEQPSLSLISVWWRYTDDKIDLLGSIDPMALAMVYAHQPTRPPNGSMIYRSEYTKAHLGSDNSGGFGRAWKTLSTSEKAVYNARAAQSALEHTANYPTYAYTQLGEKRRTTMRGALHKAELFLEERRGSMSRELFHDLELIYDAAYQKLSRSDTSKRASDRRKAAKKQEGGNRVTGYMETTNSKSTASSSLTFIATEYGAEGPGPADDEGANGTPARPLDASPLTVEDHRISVADKGRKRKQPVDKAKSTRRGKVAKVAGVSNAPTASKPTLEDNTSTKVGLASQLTKVEPYHPFTFKHSGYSNGAAQAPSSSNTADANAPWAPQPTLASMPSTDWESSFSTTLYAPTPIQGFPGFGYVGCSDGSIPSNTPQSLATTPSTSHLPTPNIFTLPPTSVNVDNFIYDHSVPFYGKEDAHTFPFNGESAVNVDLRLAHKALRYSPAHDASDIEFRRTAPLQNNQEDIALALRADAFNEVEPYISHGEATPATTQYRTDEGETYGYQDQGYSSRWDEGTFYSRDTQADLYPNTEGSFRADFDSVDGN